MEAIYATNYILRELDIREYIVLDKIWSTCSNASYTLITALEKVDCL
jgi:hypothetical protein